MQRLRNRSQAGHLLADILAQYANDPNLLILALPRGGVPVAYEVAKALNAPLDVFLVRKLGVPGHEELAMGAISMGGTRIINRDVTQPLFISDEIIERVVQRESAEIQRREAVYRQGQPPLNVSGKTVILVDDGIATGSTMLAAIKALKAQNPAKIVAAVPVSPVSSFEQLQSEVDEVICLMTPEPFWGVGMWYEDFSQTSDDEVVNLLQLTRQGHISSDTVDIPCGEVRLRGALSFSKDKRIVLFAHGSGSSANSPRNIFVAQRLWLAGISTLLFDLLTKEEEQLDNRTHKFRFDIPLLTQRLRLATEWIMNMPQTKGFAIGYFGASTGAAAALSAAAALRHDIHAVVSRGGRPDLAGEHLAFVTAPTLLIVGGRDPVVVDLNREALALMQPDLAKLTIVPGATHLFEERGALEKVADLAVDWFVRHLRTEDHPPSGFLSTSQGDTQNNADLPLL